MSELILKHAFGLNVHRDQLQAVRCLDALQKYYPESSRIVYYDGPPGEEKLLEGHCDVLHVAPYEACKWVSLARAVGHLAWLAGFHVRTHWSFLHADLFPLHPACFRDFIRRFAESGLPLTYASMWPEHECLDFCNLHFNTKVCLESGLFPLRHWSKSDFNEQILTRAFDAQVPGWRAKAYPVWTMVWPYTGLISFTDDQGVTRGLKKVAHFGHGRKFFWHNYTPETSVVHSEDPWLWDHLGEVLIGDRTQYSSVGPGEERVRGSGSPGEDVGV